MGRGAAAGAPADACRRHHGLPRLGPRRPPPQAGRDERASARDGRHAELRPVQPWPPDLCRAEARRCGEAVRKKVTTAVTEEVGYASLTHPTKLTLPRTIGKPPTKTLEKHEFRVVIGTPLQLLIAVGRRE